MILLGHRLLADLRHPPGLWRARAAGWFVTLYGKGKSRSAELIERLRAVGVNLSQPKKKAAGSVPLAGMTVVVTGTLASLSRN